MERFKIVERETKTKAYSKEGLGAAQKMDPAQRIKDEARNWLTTSITSLQIQIDQYESEIESLLAGKKKRLDRDKQDRMDELRSKLDRHKFHVTKLETLLRLLDNDNVEAEQVRLTTVIIPKSSMYPIEPNCAIASHWMHSCGSSSIHLFIYTRYNHNTMYVTLQSIFLYFVGK